MLFVYSKTMARGQTSPACGASPASQWGWGQQALPPHIEEQVGLLVQHRFDGTATDHAVIHLVPPPVAGLQEQREWGWAVSRASPGPKTSRNTPTSRVPLAKANSSPGQARGLCRSASCSEAQPDPAAPTLECPGLTFT